MSVFEAPETAPRPRPAAAVAPALSPAGMLAPADPLTESGVLVPSPLTRSAAGPRPGQESPRAAGKFLTVGTERLWVRGVTYGTFAPGTDGHRFPAREQVAIDFAAMAGHGLNAVRVYTVPPRWLLDAAAQAGLWVLIGLAWEQHVAFLGDQRRGREIIARLAAETEPIAAHPAVLAVAVGNEIPAAIVRWHGRRGIERFLERLCTAVRRAVPGVLVTYVNFPSSEYLSVAAADLVCFNVYLEDTRKLAGYLARLQILADHRPLLLTELGLDSRRNGAERQARSVSDQVHTAFDGGCAGAFVFAWTDQWHRGEDDVRDWDFGLTDRRRQPKPALTEVAGAFRDAPPTADPEAPLVSVVICTYNGAATLRACLDGVASLDYPRVDTIVVDDGSTDASAAIAREAGARVICTPNRGLSAARNQGLSAAAGEIVAYLDDDASPDLNWLTFVVRTFASTAHAAVGGPNIPPAQDTGVAACVANAPGGPVQVLLTDTEAEHIPGCNMAFRREALLRIGGFDERFHAAGDDVDICWRLRDAGMTLGFHPAAMVWHRRRSSVRRFWRQQRGYGEAEALLERKWPEKYNATGHSTWTGRLYGPGTAWIARRSRLYYGTWGTAAFQPELSTPGGRLRQLAGAPEWYLLIAALAGLSLLAELWTPLMIAVPLLVLAALVAASNALAGARRAQFGPEADRTTRRLTLRAITFLLHLLQPAARLRGRLAKGLVPWRRPDGWRVATPVPRTCAVWSETWCTPEDRLRSVARAATEHRTRVITGGPTDRWDLEFRGGALGAVRLGSVVEEHGRGRQLHRFRIRPRVPLGVCLVLGLLSIAGLAAILASSWLAGGILMTLAGGLAVAAVWESAVATATAVRAIAVGREPVAPNLTVLPGGGER
jgi:GT2 family glycosyltransferase